MASADQLKALIKSHAAGDDDRFYSVALQVAAKEARRGHAAYAQELKELVDDAKGRRHKRVVPVAKPRGDLAALLTVSYPDNRLPDLALKPDVKTQLERVLLEQRQRSHLGSHGFGPLGRLLFVGPPGTGKTLSARVLAGELRLPLFEVRLEGLITKYMGETAAKLRIVFDAMEDTRGVYLFDEVDALAGERGQDNDVGEIRRVLNSFLQFLEQDESESLIVATSNLPQALDRALFRRFDLTLEYPMPRAAEIRVLIRNRLVTLKVSNLEWNRISPEAEGLSHAEVVAAAEQAAKDSLLANLDTVNSDVLMAALRQRRKVAANHGKLEHGGS